MNYDVQWWRSGWPDISKYILRCVESKNSVKWLDMKMLSIYQFTSLLWNQERYEYPDTTETAWKVCDDSYVYGAVDILQDGYG